LRRSYLSYINFDLKTGDILSVANQPFKDTNSFEVDYTEVKPFLAGELSTNDYFIDFDYVQYCHVIKIKDVQSTFFDAACAFYKVPESRASSATLTISQTDNELIFVADTDMQRKLAANLECYINFRFSICAKNDPRIVYYIVEVPASALMEYSYTVQLASLNTNVSIYTTKKLESYAHNRLRHHLP
jgi:hypothetical protein